MVGGTAALSNSNQKSGSGSALAIQSGSLLPVPSPVAPGPAQQISPLPEPVSPEPSPFYLSQRISTCAGVGSNANFRAYPSLDSRAVLGVVAYGSSVRLTGRVIHGDGVEWFEAISPVLFPSLDSNAQNKLESGQVGWIASCFVRGR